MEVIVVRSQILLDRDLNSLEDGGPILFDGRRPLDGAFIGVDFSDLAKELLHVIAPAVGHHDTPYFASFILESGVVVLELGRGSLDGLSYLLGESEVVRRFLLMVFDFGVCLIVQKELDDLDEAPFGGDMQRRIEVAILEVDIH